MTKQSERTIVLQYAVDPTSAQIEQLKSHVGAVRFAYNYALDRVLANWSAVREGSESEYINSSAYSMRKLFNEEKDGIAPWWAENSKEAYNTGFANLQRGLTNFYKNRAGVPNFKAKANVAGLVRNRSLSRRIAHASFGRIKQFVAYKAEWYKSRVVMIDRFYPSSKTCSECGVARAKLALSERVFKCEENDCNNVMDRDLNAAVNICKKAAQSCGEALNGHGDESAGLIARSNETVVSEVSSQSLLTSA